MELKVTKCKLSLNIKADDILKLHLKSTNVFNNQESFVSANFSFMIIYADPD